MERFRSLSTIARVAVVAGVLAIGGGATAAAVTLPPHANSHAVSATEDVITGIPSFAPAGTPAPQASFGQCVAANAKTASDNGGQDWNPTTDCTKPGAEASDEVATTASGPADQSSHANPAAADGLATAATAGGNGAAHANDNGADNAAARGDNAGSHS